MIFLEKPERPFSKKLKKMRGLKNGVHFFLFFSKKPFSLSIQRIFFQFYK